MTKSTIALSLLLAVAGTSWASDHSDYAPFATEVKTSTDTEQHYYRIASDRGADNTATYHSPWLSVYSGSSFVSYDTSDDVENQVWSFEAADDNGGVYIKHYQTGKYWNSNKAVQVADKEDAAIYYLVDLTKNLIDGFAFTFVDGSFGISSVAGSTTSTFVDAGNRSTETDGTCYGILYNEWNPWDDARLWGSTDVNSNNGSVYYFQEFDIASIEQTKLDDAKSAATSTIDALIANIPGADTALAGYKSQIEALTTSDDYTTAIANINAEVEKAVATILNNLDGKTVTLKNIRRANNGKPAYLAPYTSTKTDSEGNTTTYETFNTQEEVDSSAIFKFVKQEGDNTYFLYNPSTKTYIGDLDDTTLQTTEPGDDSKYIATTVSGQLALQWASDTQYGLNLDPSSSCLTWWSYTDAGSVWSAQLADYEEPAAEAAHVSITFTGAEDGKAKLISSIQVALPEGTEPTGVNPIFTFTDPDGRIVKKVNADGFSFNENNVMTVGFGEYYLAGTYTAIIHEGSLKAGSQPIAADTATVEGTMPTFRASVTPASGNVEAVEGVTIAAPEGAEGTFYFNEFTAPELSITKNGEAVYTCKIDDPMGDDWDYDNDRATLANPKFTDEARYAMVIPVGSFTLVNDNYEVLAINETQVINWVIAGANKDNVTLTTSPAANDTITTTSAINIYEHSDYSFPKADGEGTITITKDGAEEPIASFTAAQVEENHSIDNDDTEEYGWSLPVNITEAGDYTITIPAQFFTYYADGGDINGYNDAYTATFTATGIASATLTGYYGMSNDGIALAYIMLSHSVECDTCAAVGTEPIQVVTINSDNTYSAFSTITADDLKYYGENGYSYWYAYLYYMKESFGFIIPEGFFEFYDAEGNVIARSAETSFGTPAPTASDDFTLTSDPAAGEVSEISTVTIYEGSTWSYVYATDDYTGDDITLTKDGETIFTLASTQLNALYGYTSNPDTSFWKITPESAITEEGTYTLTIPAGIITYYNLYAYYYSHTDQTVGTNEALTVVWTITSDGLRDITVNGEQQDIYDLQGRKVSVARHGQVYIIGGRKVLVK